MTRNYGLTCGTASGGQLQSCARIAQGKPRDRINQYFPSGSILAEPLDSSIDEPSKFSLIESLVASFVAGVAFVVAGVLLLINT